MLVKTMLHRLQEVQIFAIAKLSLNSTQLIFNFNFEAEIALFSDNTATNPPNHPTGKVVKLNKTSNTSIEEFKYLPSSVSTQFQLHLSLNSTQSQLNFNSNY